MTYLLHHRSHPPGNLEELRLVSVRLSFLQPGLHASLLNHDSIGELVLEPLLQQRMFFQSCKIARTDRFEALHLSMLNRKSSKQVVKLHSLILHCLV